MLVRLLTGEKGDDFGKHIVPYAIKNVNVKAYKFHGFWEDVGTIKAFFNVNIALTEPISSFDLYKQDKPIYSSPRYLPANKHYGTISVSSKEGKGTVFTVRLPAVPFK